MTDLEPGIPGLSWERVGQGSPLLLIHGGLVDSRSWVRQRELSDKLTLLLPDTRGFGGSLPLPLPSSMVQLVDDVKWVVRSEGFDSVHLLGFSLGGIIAQAVAVHRPDLVRSLTLVSTRLAPIPRSSGPAGASISPRAHVERAFSDAFRSANDSFVAEYLDMAVENAERGAMAAVAATLSEGPKAGDLESVSVPILVVHADQDAAIGVRHGERLAATLPGSTFHRFEDCGHSVHIESPAHFNHTVLAFLSTVDPAVEP